MIRLKAVYLVRESLVRVLFVQSPAILMRLMPLILPCALKLTEDRLHRGAESEASPSRMSELQSCESSEPGPPVGDSHSYSLRYCDIACTASSVKISEGRHLSSKHQKTPTRPSRPWPRSTLVPKLGGWPCGAADTFETERGSQRRAGSEPDLHKRNRFSRCDAPSLFYLALAS